MEPATSIEELDMIAAGSRVIVRDQTWQVTEVERHAMGGRAVVRCIGRDELIRDRRGSFFSDVDRIEPEDPSRTRFRLDTSPSGIETRLVLESIIRRTPVPVSNTALTVGHEMLADDLPFQREPFRLATTQLQPRLLVADAVGLGKTIEVGMLLCELQRRGRANRVLAVVPRHILDQVQHELWCRCAFPLVRLDSDGIARVRQRIPPGRNPFTYFNRVIVSVDTLKNPSRYRHHLERDDSGTERVPASRSEWDEWVSASSTRNHVLDDPLLDWLDRYGESKRFERDRTDARTDFLSFILLKGVEFERAVVQHLRGLGGGEVRTLSSEDSSLTPSRDLGLAFATWDRHGRRCGDHRSGSAA